MYLASIRCCVHVTGAICFQQVSCVLSGCHVYVTNAMGLQRVSCVLCRCCVYLADVVCLLCVPGKCCGRGESVVWPPVSARPVDSGCPVYLAAGLVCTCQRVSCVPGRCCGRGERAVWPSV